MQFVIEAEQQPAPCYVMLTDGWAVCEGYSLHVKKKGSTERITFNLVKVAHDHNKHFASWGLFFAGSGELVERTAHYPLDVLDKGLEDEFIFKAITALLDVADNSIKLLQLRDDAMKTNFVSIHGEPPAVERGTQQ